MQRDRAFLIKLSKRVIRNLREKINLSPFRFIKNQRSRQTNTEGWSIIIGKIHGYGCNAEIWLDKFTFHPSRKIQYCLYSESNSSKFKSITKLASRKFGSPFKINSNDIKYENTVVLSKRLAKNQFGRPILEQYTKDKQYFYGVYEFDQTGLKQDVLDRLVLRATDFFCDIIEALRKGSQIQNEDFPGIENRLLVTRHILRERRSHIGTLRKQNDNYVCSICDLKFMEKYGPLGSNFAEAHHITPLSSSNKVRLTTIKDLITVCANCHRMLHRMNGKVADISRLKNLVRKYKNKNK